MQLSHDLRLDVALANNRRTKTWKNQQMLWSEVVTRMESTTRTPETVAEYKRMGKTQQSEIKDVGAFVGGFCNGGSRSDIRHRSILALDADFGQLELWEDYCLVIGAAAALYSTHKHTTEHPRFRLVIPLARNVTPDEYQAIGRKVADTLGIDQFDDSTYQPQRCMFWPSTSRDGDYVFEYLDAPLLEPDTVLASYVDWKDISSWPMSSRVTEVIRHEAARQADPTEKSGLIGSFCRAYSIEAAIEKFVPEYTPCDEPNRYTYSLGSTAAGVVIYDGKFSYSHHATDPTSGQLCNAWDLVRIHKFGDQDADSDPSKPVTARPSWSAMTALAQQDDKVKQQIYEERVVEFTDLNTEEWTSALEVGKDGTFLSTIDNVSIILLHDPNIAGRIAYDEFTNNVVVQSSLPWRDTIGQWTDMDDSALRLYLEQHYKISGKDKIFDAVNVVASENKFHPVREYLDSCDWDGVPRLETMLVDYLGAVDCPYTRAVTRKAMIAAVSRIYSPGCKFDYMLTIQGKQGLGKSALIKKLGGKWFSDSFTTLQGKDAYEQIQGSWIVEIGELAGMRKAEAETIKLYISKQVDRFRPAYGRRTQEFPRQCIFIGTTNETHFLRDATGNRRFWIVSTPNKPKKDLWDDMTDEVIRNIWGEAVQLFHEGEELFLKRELEETARDIQSEYEEENPQVGLVVSYLDRLLPKDWYDMDLYARRSWLEGDNVGTVQRMTVSYVEVWAEALNGSPERMERYDVKRISDIMCSLPNWTRKPGLRAVKPYGRQRYFERCD